MARSKISLQEWQTFFHVAKQLGIDLQSLQEGEPRFHDLEAAGHAIGRAVAQAVTERLALARAERLCEPQPCPTCGRLCPTSHRDRPLETIDGSIELHESVCHCPVCRRDFFPSASGVGSEPASL